MILLKKKKSDGTYFDFDKILRSGYEINEQENEIATKKMANGKRKKIYTSYVDCVIKINLGLLDNTTYQEYKAYLTDGEFQYWSYKYNQMKNANFIITKPSITIYSLYLTLSFLQLALKVLDTFLIMIHHCSFLV